MSESFPQIRKETAILFFKKFGDKLDNNQGHIKLVSEKTETEKELNALIRLLRQDHWDEEKIERVRVIAFGEKARKSPVF